METIRHKRLRPFEQQVLQTIRRRRLLEGGERVLAAVSGGSDSTALLCALRALEPELRLTVACGHIDHGIHAASGRHAEAVRDLAERLGVPACAARVDATAHAAAAGLSLEHAAREVRYAALERLAAEQRCTAIATGHTASDQAETVLLHLLRGTGTRGLRGIPARRGVIVRPLLDVHRQAARDYLAERGVPYLEDPTNESPDPLRNRIRQELLPLLDRILGRPTETVLARHAETVALEDEALLAAQEAFGREARSPEVANGEAVVLSVEALRHMGRGGAALALRQAAREVAGEGRDLSFAQIGQVLRLLNSETAGGVQRGGGCEFRRDHGALRVQRAPGAGK